MVYVNQKPMMPICENTAYAKILDSIKPYFTNAETGFPYKGAKERYAKCPFEFVEKYMKKAWQTKRPII